ncbi:MAG: bifunctional diaminohydroxyphosphoribosylaminopyrimidine deaminase/5-amino-6-(5-phosphoribosylamino)uracil reductase RibD [Paracoccus sp. (in: a-proteobacteria)]|nr:bifunctional diaminohydroxyphosphoribosylaminopyrimidine deaminase/5-amino-6-(5-phosphoribosylamino)uracil reductase RibD [Paracoccus sp. (in: a-proteobacteria)]
MAHALRLARRGLGNVWPNPAVGCVLVRGGRIVGRGWTRPGGRPHAERVALDQAGGDARGATAYVTLEPCAHHGQTPPCADALIGAGVARVVSAMTDPDPRTAGQGHARLRRAGIEVTEGIRAAEAAHLQRGFVLRVTEGRPLVTLKLACTLDGRIATASGESRWITAAPARARVHLLRAQHDAVMVGGGTARADLPALNVRGLGDLRQPLRVVLSSRELPSAIPPEDAAHGPLIRLGGEPGAVLADLAARGVTRVFCEGGGQLAAGLLSAGLVDDLVVFGAGLALGAGGVPAIAALPDGPLGAAPRFRLTDAAPVGPDLYQLWTRVPA